MTELRRSISLPGLVLYGLGTTIGAGIYALTGVLAARAGWLMPLAFASASLLALFTAFSFAELSSRYPRAGGEAVYVQEGFRWRPLSTAVGLLVVLAGIVSAAAVCVAFGGYLSELIGAPRAFVTAASVLAIGGIAAWGVRESVGVVAVMTLLECGGIVAVVAYGAPELAQLPERLPEMWPDDRASILQVIGAAVLAFYAFLGFEDLVNVAEEVRDVRRALPRAILATLAITTLLYVAVATVALLVVPPEELAGSDAPLVLVFERAGGSGALLGAIALMALLNGALIQVVKSSRVLYGLARLGGLPAALGEVSARRRTPVRATALSTLVVVVLAATLPLAALAETTAVITLFTFGLANLALLVVKRRDPKPEGVVVFPAWLPATGVLVSVLLLAAEAGLRIG